MKDIIKADLCRYIPGDYSIDKLIKGFRSQGFRYLFFRRLVDTTTWKNPVWLLYKLCLRHYMYKYGFQIGGQIGKGLYIGHFGHIVTSTECIIGDNCNIAPGVTIGVTRRGDRTGAPVLGSQVWIGTNAVIVGKINIGNDVLIAPGAYVNFDVPDHSVVIGNPGIIKPTDGATMGYINNQFEALQSEKSMNNQHNKE